MKRFPNTKQGVEALKLDTIFKRENAQSSAWRDDNKDLRVVCIKNPNCGEDNAFWTDVTYDRGFDRIIQKRNTTSPVTLEQESATWNTGKVKHIFYRDKWTEGEVIYLGQYHTFFDATEENGILYYSKVI